MLNSADDFDSVGDCVTAKHHIADNWRTRTPQPQKFEGYGAYYEHVEINSKNRLRQSSGTDAFISDFDRLMRKCVGALEADTEPEVSDSFAYEVRDCFELLFALVRRIDEGSDDLLAFSNDGSSLDVGVDWRVVLPAYIDCLAETDASSPEEFVRAVDEAIAEFAQHDQAHYKDVARKAAKDVQRLARMSKLATSQLCAISKVAPMTVD